MQTAWTENQSSTALLQGQGVKVGILDTGAQSTNPALVNRITSYTNYAGANTSSQDVAGHGTIVAEVLGGIEASPGSYGNEPFQGSVAPQSSLYVSRVLPDNGTGSLQYVPQAYQDLLNQGVRLFNNSYGQTASITSVAGQQNDPNSSLTAETAYYQSAVDKGGLLVWAAGNQGASQPGVEAGMPYLEPSLQKGWLAVVNVSLDANGNVTGLDTTSGVASNACGVAAAWCLAAPGTVWASGVPGTTFSGGGAEGTSISTPIVTGVAALVWQQFPYFTGNNVQETILGTATALGDPSLYGYGLVNAAKAVEGPGRFDWGVFDVTIPTGASGTFANSIAGTGSLQLDGAGTLTLTGANSYSGGTTVNGGVLLLQGNVASDVTVAAAGSLYGTAAGTGVVNANVINNGTAGTGLGNLAIKGNYTANASSTTNVLLGTALKVSGSVTLNGGIAQVTDTGSYTPKAVEPFVVSGTGLTGSFSSLSFSNVFTSGTLSYTPTEADVEMTRSSVAAVAAKSLPGSATTQQTAAHIETSLKQADQFAQTDPAAHAPFLAAASVFLSAPTLEAAAASINSLSGQIHASSQALTFQQEGIVNRALADRLTDPGASNRSGGWFQGTGSNGDIASSGYASGKFSGGGALAGYDLPLADNFVAGAALSWNNLSSTYADATGTSQTRSNGLSFYGRYDAGNAYLAGRVGYDWITSNVSRWALLGGNVDPLHSRRNDSISTVYGEAGYHVQTQTVTVTPFASVGFSHLDRGQINELGANGFGLAAADETFNQSTGQLGARLTRDWNWNGGHTWFTAYALWQRVLSGSNLAFDAAYQGAPGATFSVEGVNSVRSSAWVGLGLTTQLRSNWSYFVNLDGQLTGGDTKTRELSAGLRWSF